MLRSDAPSIPAVLPAFGPAPWMPGAISTISFRSGTENLVPEKSQSINLGILLEPGFVPGLTLTADYWEVDQRGLVGTFGDDNAIANGILPTDVVVGGLGELLEIEGRPKWRFSGSINWESGPVDVGVFTQYVGEVWDTSVTRDVLLVSDDVNANYYRVDDALTFNLSIAYTFNTDDALDRTRIRLAVNNVFDKDPPLADETYGYFSELHSSRGRVFHVEIRKRW